MAIPSVMQGLIEAEDGKVFELDSPRGAAWLESVASFRFEPAEANKPYTVRKESGKGGDYWYGYRKVSGKLHKRYIGKSSELTTAKLEEIAEALNVPPEPRLQKVTQSVIDSVTQAVTDTVTRAEFVALQSKMQALQESLESFQDRLPGKSESGDSPELPTVTDDELQIRLGNLESENAELRRQIENSDHLTRKLKEDVQKLRSQLTTANQDASDWQKEIEDLKSQLASRAEQNSTPIAIELPEPADLLNQLKGKRKKSKAELADVVAILEILEPTAD